jgi:hypothetical protein
MLLAACHSTPQLEHREISIGLKAGLKTNTRAPTKDEIEGDGLAFKISVDQHGPVTLPMFWTDGMPQIMARINKGKEFPILLDTGAGRCLLQARTAVRNHLDILDLPGANLTANGSTGSEQILMGLAKDFSLGPWKVEQLPLFVRTHETRVRNGLKRETMETDMFGMDIIPLVCDYLTFDFPAQRIVLGMGGRFPTPSGKNVWRTPMVLRDGRPFVQLRSCGVSWEAGVDTGYFGTLDIKKSTAEQLHLTDKVQPAQVFAFGLGSPVEGESAHFDVVPVPQLDGIGPRQKEVPACLVPERCEAIIGCKFLRPYRVTFDYRRDVIWLEK